MIKKKKDTEKARKFWKSVEEAAERVKEWPEWKRSSISISDKDINHSNTHRIQAMDIYKDNSLTLNTDLYQLTMAQGYWKNGRANTEAIFHLFYREAPFNSEYTITAGRGTAIDYLDNHFEFTESDLEYLSSIRGKDGNSIFEDEFLSYLSDMEFECDVDMMREGWVSFPHEPIVWVRGPIIQAQLIETALLNCFNYQTLVATKSHLIKQAANDKSVLEFGLRRAQGLDGGFSAARASYIGGVDGTSNVLAGKHFEDIPVKGTHAHSWVQSYDVEIESFRDFAKAQPNNAVFLVDTYDTIEGVKKAIEVGKEMRERGHEMVGIRLDSGDLCELSKDAREILDEHGFESAKIIASDGLDVDKIQYIEENGGQVDAYGVGTNLVTCQSEPALGGVYKLAAIKEEGQDWKPKIKLSDTPEKTSIPGSLHPIRIYDKDTKEFKRDVIINRLEENGPDYDPFEEGKLSLTTPVFNNGELPDHDIRQSLGAKRMRMMEHTSRLPDGVNKVGYNVQLSQKLDHLRNRLIEENS